MASFHLFPLNFFITIFSPDPFITKLSISSPFLEAESAMKPDGKSPPIKHTGKTGVSSTKAVSGDPTSKKPNGKAVLHSDSSAKTCVSSARSVSGDPMSKKPNDKAVVSSPRADEVVFFRDVEFGPQEGELMDTDTKLAERRVIL
ncbi:unnamed protein product [Brassica napus]|nr:unnamed protein product [Brassica napus]